MDSDQWQYLSFHYRRTLSLESSSSFPSLPDQYNVCSLIDVLLLPIIRYDVEVNVSYVKLLMYIFINNKTCNFRINSKIAGLIYLFKTYPYMEAILKNVLSR